MMMCRTCDNPISFIRWIMKGGLCEDCEIKQLKLDMQILKKKMDILKLQKKKGLG